ncbi:hypothetical protein ABKA04_003304 [Annulohypoxylon sp. FPYF3050]
MNSGRHYGYAPENIAWAGNGVLTYYDPDFPYGQQPERVNNAAYYADEYGYPMPESPDYPQDMRLPPPSPPPSVPRSCNVQYPFGRQQVFEALVRHHAESAGYPDSPSSANTLVPDYSPSLDGSENPEIESDCEEEPPRPIRPPVHRRRTMPSQRPAVTERRERHVTFSEHQEMRYYSPPPSSSSSPPPSPPPSTPPTPPAPLEPPSPMSRQLREAYRSTGRGSQIPTYRHMQEQVVYQQPQQQPAQHSSGEGRRRRRRRPRAQTGPSVAAGILSARMEAMSMRSPPPSPPRPLAAVMPPPSRRRSPTPAPPRRRMTLPAPPPSSPPPSRGRRRRQSEEEPERGRSQTPRPVTVESAEESEPEQPRQAQEPQEVPQPKEEPQPKKQPTEKKRPGILRTPTGPRVSATNQFSDQPAKPSRRASHSGTPAFVHRNPKNFAEQLGIIDAQSNILSRARRDDESVSSMAVNFHIHNEPMDIPRRRHHRHRRDSSESWDPPKKKKTSRLSFLSHLRRHN